MKLTPRTITPASYQDTFDDRQVANRLSEHTGIPLDDIIKITIDGTTASIERLDSTPEGRVALDSLGHLLITTTTVELSDIR